MTNIWKRIVTLSLLFFLVTSAFSQGGSDTLRVLFVGNSYTYFWNLPQTVEAMAASVGKPLKVRQSTAGGTSWMDHWNGKKGLKSRELIQQNEWDIVILQNHSKSTLEYPDRFMEYGSMFIDLVRENGAEPILYQTWARAYNPLMQKTVSAGYDQLAKQEGVQVVRIGELWEKARTLRPDINLHDPDQSHPSTIGTYLTACGFFQFLTGEKATLLNKRVTDIDKNGQKLYLSIMSQQNATFLQELVVDSVKERKGVLDDQ